jgi:hypothetical protein
VTRISRVTQIQRDACDYIFRRSEHLERNHQLDAVKKVLRDWLQKNGTEDDDGNLVYSFPRAIAGADSKSYKGVILRKTIGSAYFHEEEVKDFMALKFPTLHDNPYNRVFRMVEVMDPDELYVLQQEGRITEAELRSLIHYPKPSYALWPVESTTPLEEEE